MFYLRRNPTNRLRIDRGPLTKNVIGGRRKGGNAPGLPIIGPPRIPMPGAIPGLIPGPITGPIPGGAPLPIAEPIPLPPPGGILVSSSRPPLLSPRDESNALSIERRPKSDVVGPLKLESLPLDEPIPMSRPVGTLEPPCLDPPKPLGKKSGDCTPPENPLD